MIHLDASCSAVIQRTLPQKEKDHGRVMLPITIGNIDVRKTFIDIGLDINLVPLSVVKRICDPDMKQTKMTLQLANKYIVCLSGIAKDVLVKVDKFLFPLDFMVMYIEANDEVPLVLDRPFMKITRMIIDVDDGLMKVRVQDEDVSFSLFEAIKHPNDKGVCYNIDANDEAENIKRSPTNELSKLSAEEEKKIGECLKGLDMSKEFFPLEAKIEKTTVEMSEKIPSPKKVKGIRRSRRQAKFYKRIIKDLIKMAKQLRKLYQKANPYCNGES